MSFKDNPDGLDFYVNVVQPVGEWLTRQPDQGEWPWFDHCVGVAGYLLEHGESPLRKPEVLRELVKQVWGPSARVYVYAPEEPTEGGLVSATRPENTACPKAATS